MAFSVRSAQIFVSASDSWQKDIFSLLEQAVAWCVRLGPSSPPPRHGKGHNSPPDYVSGVVQRYSIGLWPMCFRCPALDL